MANAIELINKQIPLLDEVYKLNSLTSDLETSNEFVKETADAKTVQVAELTTQGLGNYSREGGFVKGNVTLEWKSHTYRYDRGRTFSIDAMDDAETVGLAFGRCASTFLKDEVIPEIDATRFALYANGAGLSAIATLDKTTICDAILDAEVAMGEKEVTLENARLYITPTHYGNICKDTTHFQRTLTPSENPNRNFGVYDEMPIVKVPQGRFYTNITLYDGETSGQEAGGYVKSVASYGLTEDEEIVTGKTYYTRSGSAGAYTYTAVESPDVDDIATYYEKTAEEGKNINFMIIKPDAVTQITKHAKLRIFAPDVNQTADAYKIDYRIYHDAWILANKKNGIYCHHVA